ncbi:MAG TPA: 3-hydroxyacyl-CoA dehydrogenase NAD-binding domain-containing protein, partial [Jiangellaceae bacterium]|nr:3-hydroxyacyl-CoA dehydrogenase NAD-binding domain-containing protein [Jiangellaceae bacterium]
MATNDSPTTTDLATLFPDEVVTHAHVRFVELPLSAGKAALITLDNGFDHTKPNTLGPATLLGFEKAIDAAYAEPGVVAVAVTGKPFILAAGADLKGMSLVTQREQAVELGRIGHRVLGKLGAGPVPTFAFINGLALGGGLEVALNCTYRTVSKAAPAVALPEVFLGLVPGWGGAWLLPNLVGAAAAIKIVIENPLNQNRMLKGADVAELGIADTALDGADFLEQSLLWAAKVVRGDVTVERAEIDRDEATWNAAVARGRAVADMKVHGAAPAPYRALDLIAAARTATKAEGFAAEDEALGDLVMSQELRSGVYAFDLTQRRAKRPAGAPDPSLARPVTTVGIVGAGLMASQLALLFVRRLEVPVVMTDLDQTRVDKGVGYVHAEIDKLLGKGRISPDKANRLRALVTGSTDKASFATADFVIEAVFEEMKVKQHVFAEVEAVVSPDCVLATNTSSLSVTEMAAALKHPERVVGFHFFNPVAVLPLLEIARAERTDDASLATAFAVGKTLKKSCVLVKDAPAFVVNRILTRFIGEITKAADEGTPLEVADNAVAPLGLPMSPFVLLQLVGPAVALHVSETLHEAFPDRFGVSENLRRLVAAGKPGIWSWNEHGKPYLDDDTRALFEQGNSPLDAEQVRERALSALAQ